MERTVIIAQGSQSFSPVSPSLTGLQSNQMLASHSNQMDIPENSVLPIHPVEFSGEIYDMGSTQYNNMNFAAHLNVSGAKTIVPTKKSVRESVDERCPTQNSLYSPGASGEGISLSRSILASDEAEDQQGIDVRKQRRMMSNRESARRSRLRKQHHFDELRAQVAHLRAENGQILDQFNIASQHYAHIIEENGVLRSQALELSRKLQRLHDMINAHSHGVFKTMGIETGNCSAAHLSTESGTNAYSFIPSDFLF